MEDDNRVTNGLCQRWPLYCYEDTFGSPRPSDATGFPRTSQPFSLSAFPTSFEKPKQQVLSTATAYLSTLAHLGIPQRAASSLRRILMPAIVKVTFSSCDSRDTLWTRDNLVTSRQKVLSHTFSLTHSLHQRYISAEDNGRTTDPGLLLQPWAPPL